MNIKVLSAVTIIVTMFTYHETFFKTCTDKDILACALSIKEDQQEGNLTRAIETFGRDLVNKALFDDHESGIVLSHGSNELMLCNCCWPFLEETIETYDYINNNIDCVNCTNCFGCIGCNNCYGCMWCVKCKGCIDCDVCTICTLCKDARNCSLCELSINCTNCHESIGIADTNDNVHVVNIANDLEKEYRDISPFMSMVSEYHLNEDFTRNFILMTLGTYEK